MDREQLLIEIEVLIRSYANGIASGVHVGKKTKYSTEKLARMNRRLGQLIEFRGRLDDPKQVGAVAQEMTALESGWSPQ